MKRAKRSEQGWGTSSSVPGYGQMVSKQEAANAWGVSVRTIERLISAGKLRKYKIAGCVRLQLADVLRFAGIEPQMQQP